MLTLALKPGEYITIGENVVVQYSHTTAGNRCRLSIDAPRDVPIVRGEVREREGERRPDCVMNSVPRYTRELRWDNSKSQTLAAMRRLLARMDDHDSSVQTLRRQLDHMFPPEKAENPEENSTI